MHTSRAIIVATWLAACGGDDGGVGEDCSFDACGGDPTGALVGSALHLDPPALRR